MADATADVGMKFRIEADMSGFGAAMQRVDDAQQKVAEGMARKFDEASDKAEKAVEGFAARAILKTVEFLQKLQNGGTAIAEVFREGADGAEKAVTGAFESMNGSIDGVMNGILGKVPGIWGKVGQASWNLLKTPIFAGLDALKPIVADKIDGLVAAIEPASQKIRDALVAGGTQSATMLGFDDEQVRKAQEKVEKFADTVKSSLDEAATDARTALQKIAGTFQGISETVQTLIEGMSRQLAIANMETEAVGKSAGERAKLRAELEQSLTLKKADHEANEQEQEALDEINEKLRTQVDARQSAERAQRSAMEFASAKQAILTSLEREIEMEKSLADAITKTAGARARERAEAQVQGFGRKGQGDTLLADPEVQAAIDEKGRAADAAAATRYTIDLTQAVGQQQEAYRLQAAVLGLTAGEAAKLKFESAELLKLQRAGVPATDEWRTRIEMAAGALGKSADNTAVAIARMKDFQDIGRSVASSLESAFDRWISGTKVSFKELVNSMIADLARLQMRKGLEMLLGTGSGGGGLSSILAGFFGGPKAEGGPVASGKAYLVGERGPEIFVPSNSGAIVNNSAAQRMGGGSNVKVNVFAPRGTDVETRERNEGGVRIVDVMLSAVKKEFAAGGFDSTMRGRFGASPATRMR